MADNVRPGLPAIQINTDFPFVHGGGGPFYAGNLYQGIPTQPLHDNNLLKRGSDGSYYVVTVGRFIGVTIDKYVQSFCVIIPPN